MPIAQGYPDPYSSFSQGLTGGLNTSMNIMQMMQQKAQAARDNSLKSFATGAEIMKNQDFVAMHDSAYDMMKTAWGELNPKSEFPSKESFGDKGRAKRLDGIMKIEDPKMQFEALSAELAMAPKGTQKQFKPYLEFKEKQATTQERERKISGTPSTPGLPSIPAQNFGPLSMGEIPGYSGTPGQIGLRTLAQEAKMSPLETEKMQADYLATGKFDVPKDEKETVPMIIDGKVVNVKPETVLLQDEREQRRKYQEQKDREYMDLRREILDLQKDKTYNQPLRPKQVADLTEMERIPGMIKTLKATYKPEYSSGDVVRWLGAGDLALGAAERFGVSKDAVNWWKTYKQTAELPLRHELFGATLTGNEKTDWTRATINPNTAPNIVKGQLDVMLGIAGNKYNMHLANIGKSRYDITGWELFGEKITGGGKPANDSSGVSTAADFFKKKGLIK